VHEHVLHFGVRTPLWNTQNTITLAFVAAVLTSMELTFICRSYRFIVAKLSTQNTSRDDLRELEPLGSLYSFILSKYYTCFMDPECLLSCPKEHAIETPILSQMIPIHSLTPCLFTIPSFKGTFLM
jgi:hypothetical protein